ncbi:hypothetical protein IJ579_06950 [bacterium]|nr:hypothetical protein [bacterium]
MGMSASQARFLSLTARKTNVEYEGQQINQQRTVLANESSDYYSRLTNLSVPTPPSSSDYTKTVYTFTDGGETNTINSMIAQKDGYYLVSYTRSYPTESVMSNGTVLVVRGETETENGISYDYYVGATKLRQLGKNAADDPYLSTLSEKDRGDALLREKQYEAMLQDKYSDSDWAVRYVKNSDGLYNPVFYSLTQLQNSKFNENGVSLNLIKSYVYGQTTETSEVKNAKARAEQDANGRYKNIIIYTTDAEGKEQEVYYSLEVASTNDDAAYNDAMNKFNYDKAQYDKTIQDVNSKLAQVQQQDKSLELKLKQLDTEQNAIATEMEAVTKVISKNVTDTFKTFEA